jgi:carbon storage regulator
MALTVSRKPGESILIDDKIKIEVVKVEGTTVRIRVDAPPEYLILRDELAEKLAQEISDAHAT